MPVVTKKQTHTSGSPDPGQNKLNTSFSEAWLASIVKYSNDAIISKTLDGIITSWNQGAERMFGFTDEEMLGNPISVLIPADRMNEEQEIINKIRNKEFINHFETVRLCKDGSEVCVSLSVSPIIDAAGMVIGASKIARDISEKKILEKTLIKSEREYRTLFEDNPIPMWIVRKSDHKFIGVNTAALNHYQYTRREFLNLTAIDIRPEEDIQRYLDHRSTMNFGVPSQQGIWKHKKKDGTIITVEIFADDTIYENEPARIILANDITERFKFENELIKEKELSDSFVNSLPGIFYLFDTDGNFLRWNKNFEKVTGYTAEEIAAMRPLDFFDPGEQKGLKKKIENVFESGTDFSEAHLLTKNKERIPYFFTGNQHEYAGKRCLIGTGIDISERKKANEELIKAETSYREIFEKASDSIYIHEIETGRVIAVNDKATEVTGFSKDELMNSNPIDFITDHPNYSLEKAIGYIQKAAAGIPQNFEWLGKNRDGSKSWYEVNLKRASIAGIDRILAFFRQIDDRKKSEEEVLKEKELSDSIINSLPGIFYLFDETGKFLRWNKNFETVTEYTAEEITKMQPLEFFPADEHPLIQKSITDVFKSANDSVEAHLLTKSKKKIPYFFTGDTQYYQGKKCLIGTGIDISGRKKAEDDLTESEERFRFYVTASSDIVYKMSADWLTMYNLDGKNFLKSTLEANTNWVDVYIPEHERQKVKDTIADAIANKKIFELEHQVFDANGGLAWTHSRAVPRLDENGEIKEWIGVAMDVTERKNAAQAILLEKELSDSIINSLPGIFYLYNEQRKFIKWNRNFEIVSGYTANELADMHPLDFFDKEEKSLLEEKIASVFKNGEDNVNTYFVNKDKKKIPYHFTGIVGSFGGEICQMGIGIDISKQKEAEEIAAKSEQRLTNTLDQMLEGMQIIDFDWKYIYVNDAITRQGKYTREQFIGHSIMDLYPGVEQTDTYAILQKAMNDRIPQHVENEFTFPDGSSSWFELSIQPVPEGIFILSVDITERKKAEQNLRQSLKETSDYKFALDESSMIAITDANGIITYANDNFCSIAQYMRHELIGMDHRIVNSGYHPHEFMKELWDTIKAGKIWRGEIKNKRRDGTLYWVDTTIVPFLDENDKPYQYIAIRKNITERKKAEEELISSEEKRRLIMNSALDAIICIDTRGDIIFWNPQAEKIFGWKEREVMDLNLSGIIIPERYRSRHTNAMQNYLKTGRIKSRDKVMELSAIHKNGQEFPVELIVHPIKQHGEEFFCAFIRDITERKNAEKAVRERNDQLRNLTAHIQSVREEERTRIAREVHDELGQELTSLKMDVGWLRTKAKNDYPMLSERINSMMDMVNEAIQTVRKIIQELRPGILDDLGLVAALEWQAKDFEQHTGIVCTFHSAVEHEKYTREISTTIFRIFQETLTNVMRYAQASEVMAELYESDGQLVFEVLDNGIGIEEFEKNKKTSYGILGMKERAAMLKGSFSIQKLPKGGTGITLKIPLS